MPLRSQRMVELHKSVQAQRHAEEGVGASLGRCLGRALRHRKFPFAQRVLTEYSFHSTE